MTKVVGYMQVSTQGQVRDGYSLGYQRDKIMRYCADNGYWGSSGLTRMRTFEGRLYVSLLTMFDT